VPTAHGRRLYRLARRVEAEFRPWVQRCLLVRKRPARAISSLLRFPEIRPVGQQLGSHARPGQRQHAPAAPAYVKHT
jgi:hypothetical protein